MSFINRYNSGFLLVVACSVGCIVITISGLSISHREALLYFDNSTLIARLANICTDIFGRNDYALRIPNIVFHTANLALVYLISRNILRHRIDSVLCVMAYALIPGVIIQGVLVNEAIIMLFVTLLVCYLEIKNSKLMYVFLVIAIFISSSAFMLFLALFIYSIYKRRIYIAIFALLCFSVNIYLYGVDILGKPSGRFLEVVGELALLYSPMLFVYYVYTLYVNITKSKKSLLLFVSVTSLVVSFLLSIRQGVDKEVFMFMSVCGIPLMVAQSFRDIRVRLPQFQQAYKNRFIIMFVCLVLESSLLVYPKILYMVVDDTQDLFLNSYYIAREVSDELKKRNISRVQIEDSRMRKRLLFYGIGDGGQKLRKVKKNGNIIIRYHDVVVAQYAI